MDIIRGIAIIAVLLIHISATALNNAGNFAQEQLVIWINQMMRFAVPIFLVLSGWGLTISGKHNQKYTVFLKSKLSKILFWYLLWSVIYYAFNTKTFNLTTFAKDVFLGTSSYHLYYVPIIIVFYVIYPFFYNVFSNGFALLCFLLLTIISQCVGIFVGISFLNHPLNIFNWLFFFVFGVWLAKNFSGKVEWIKRQPILWVTLFILTGCILVIEVNVTIETLGISLSTTSTRPSVIIFSIVSLIAFISVNWNGMLKKTLINLASVSYGIYLSHVFVLIVFERLWGNLGFVLSGVVFIATSFIIVLAISYCISFAMDKLELCTKGTFNKKKVLSYSAK